jgi:antitoxin (DNA-binding transcriptional repressor) of toxin-antitoxin stability system
MVIDHSKNIGMDEMAISRFKATCLATLERVRATGRPLRITRFGKPVADIVPPAPQLPTTDWMGSLEGTIEIRGDIVGPTGHLAKWKALE